MPDDQSETTPLLEYFTTKCRAPRCSPECNILLGGGERGMGLLNENIAKVIVFKTDLISFKGWLSKHVLLGRYVIPT